MFGPHDSLTAMLRSVVGLLSTNLRGRRLTVGSDDDISFVVSELTFTPIAARPLPRLERQAERARQVVESSMLDPLGTIRRGAKFLTGAVEETIGALQELPFDPTESSIDLADAFTASLDDVAAPTWTIANLTLFANKVTAAGLDAVSTFELVVEDLDITATLTADQLVAIADSRLPSGFGSRITDQGLLMVDWLRARRHVGANCRLSAADGTLVAEISHGQILGLRVPLPKRFRHRHVVDFTDIVPRLNLSEMTMSGNGVALRGSTPDWTYRVSAVEAQTLLSQLGAITRTLAE